MNKNKKRVLLILLTVLSIISIAGNSYAHPGKTDSNGGHKDNQNKSGLGSYHYHCGGYPAHLHTNGVCPYASDSTSSNNSGQKNTSKSYSSSNLKDNNNSNSSSSKNSDTSKETTTTTSSSSSTTTSSETSSKTKTPSDTKTTSTKPATVEATDIQIDPCKTNIEVGENQELTATITPNNVTNSEIEWKSSDESIVTIRWDGMLKATKPGKVYITAKTSNGKTDTIELNVQEKVENTIKETTINNGIDNTIENNTETSNPVVGILVLAIIGGGGYALYKTHKRAK